MYKKKFKYICLCIFVFGINYANMSVASERIALIIGNADYSFGKLKNPVNDALDIAKALENFNFQVNVLTNASLAETTAALISHADRLKSQSKVGIIYFAGHGIQIDAENFLVPIDTSFHSVNDFKQTALPLSKLIKQLDKTKNNLNLVILDSCRDNPFNNSKVVANSRSLAGKINNTNGLAPLTDSVSTGIVFWYATRPGKIALDGEGRNSPFSRYLVDAINTTKDPARTIISRVALNMRDSQIDQQPWQEGIWLQDFHFNENIANKSSLNNTNTDSGATDKDLLHVLREYIGKCKHKNAECKNIEAAKDFENKLNSGTMNMSLLSDKWEAGSLGEGALGIWQCNWQHDDYKYLKGTATIEYYKFDNGILHGRIDNSACQGIHNYKVDITKKPLNYEIRYPQSANCTERTVSTVQHTITPLGQRILKGRYTWYHWGRSGTGKSSCIKMDNLNSTADIINQDKVDTNQIALAKTSKVKKSIN